MIVFVVQSERRTGQICRDDKIKGSDRLPFDVILLTTFMVAYIASDEKISAQVDRKEPRIDSNLAFGKKEILFYST